MSGRNRAGVPGADTPVIGRKDSNAIAAIIGRDGLAQLIKARGGGQVYIPKPEHVAEDHWLALAIGLTAARALARNFMGERLDIPSGRVRARHDAIIAVLAEGKSTRAVALQFNIHIRTVRRHGRSRWKRKSSAQRQQQVGA